MFNGNPKMHEIKRNDKYVLIFHEYYSEYQIVLPDGYVIMTIHARFGRKNAVEIFNQIEKYELKPRNPIFNGSQRGDWICQEL